MAHSVTVTGQLGPARAVTALAIPNAIEVMFIPDPKVLRVKTSDVSGNYKDFDISAATTVTCTITAGAYAFVVS